MKATSGYVILNIFCLLLLCSCQKGIVWESIGTLKKDSGNTCMSIIVNGSYSIQKTLTDSNNLVVEVNVTLPGTYHIYTDTLNNYSFNASGSFKTNGLMKVKLSGTGKPDTSGTDHFSVFYLESVCQASVTVDGTVLPPSLPAASYSFQDNSGTCLEDSVYGVYAKNFPLSPTSFVIVNVNISKTGFYHITTDTVNGYWFSGKGEFSATGTQSVVLTASGTPLKEEKDKFLLQSDSANSTCGFSTTVLGSVVPVLNRDLLPLAANNFWVYDDLVNTGDSVTRTINGTSVENGNEYFITNEHTKYENNQYLFRKTAGPYYEYALADKYTSSVKYNKNIDTDLLFLNEILTTGSTWETPEVKEVASFGQIIFLKYTYTCTEANTVVALNGNVFGNVYKIMMLPQIRSEYAGYNSTGEFYTYYYAKGIGLIYYKLSNTFYTDEEIQIRRWHVN